MTFNCGGAKTHSIRQKVAETKRIKIPLMFIFSEFEEIFSVIIAHVFHQLTEEWQFRSG
jgi:hypothetical protein